MERWSKVRASSEMLVAILTGVMLLGAGACGGEDADKVSSSISEALLAQSRLEWRKSMTEMALPKDGCFTATHPNSAWEELPCAIPSSSDPGVPYVGGGPFGTDFVVQPTDTIYWAEGSFPVVSGLISEQGTGGTQDSYSLQLNSNKFTTSAAFCPGCDAWQQFVYGSDGQLVVQYWLFSRPSCPTGWNRNGSNCWINGAKLLLPALPIKDLPNMSLLGLATFSDVAYLTIGNNTIYAVSSSSMLGLSSKWTNAEFNVYGNGDGATAFFNPGLPAGLTMVVQTLINTVSHSAAIPICPERQAITAEANSLSLVHDSCCPFSGRPPGIQFTQTDVPGGVPPQNCPLHAAEVQKTVAVQGSDNSLWLDPNGFVISTGLAMKPGTVPSLATSLDGSLQIGFQGSNGHLWFFQNGGGGSTDTGKSMSAGSSPSVTMLNTQIASAFRGSNGTLWIGQSGPSSGADTGKAMAANTSPSIAARPNGSQAALAVAFQGSNGHLWVGQNGPTGITDSGAAMAAGTSPSIMGQSGGTVAFAFQGSNGHLWVNRGGPASNTDTGLAMKAGTSPSIGSLGNTLSVAFQASTGRLKLWQYNTSTTDTGFDMAPNASPSLVSLTGGAYQIAFKQSAGNLWIDVNGVGSDQLLGLN